MPFFLKYISRFGKLHFAVAMAFFCTINVFATHNRAGEITFKQITQYTFEITVTTYTHSESMTADRQFIPVIWGDGTQNDVHRCVGCQTYVGPKILKNTYTTRHTYPGPGRYLIQFEDPNRIRDILNMENSVSVPFYLEAWLVIDPMRGGFNNSPVLLQPPIDFACPGRIFLHNPNAYDPDGDSLVFTLIPPRREKERDVPGYRNPNVIATSPSSIFTLDKFTGELTWNYPGPGSVGIYNIAILIEEYRNGVLIGYTVRDMQIIVQPCNNNPPIIKEIKDTCVEAGSNINLLVNISATDPNLGDEITLTATGGPMLFSYKPAFLNPNIAIGKDSVKAVLNWQVDCQHIRKQPYRIVFRAVDNDQITPLTDIEHIDVRVVGPAPKNLSAAATGNGVQLNWQKPNCDNARAYLIYRKIDSSHWNHAYCETGVPGYTGFVLIDTVYNPNILEYYDDNHGESLSPGLVYCYRVTALYLNEGNYEFAEGYASPEACAQLKKDVPVITHVSVRTTGITDGSIYVAWSKPTELDTIQHPGPYQYKLYRSEGHRGANFTLINSFASNTLSGLTDTTYIDTLINTSANPYSYKIEFYNTLNGQPNLVGKTITASSVYLQIERAHYKLNLKWEVVVPWKNNYYVVYKKNAITNDWDSIATTIKKTYTDTGLELGKTYCYKIKSVGSYFTSGFTDPLINFSQEVCSRPKDSVPPCAPGLEAAADCETRTSSLTWFQQNAACDADVVKYKIYFSPLRTNNFILVDSTLGFNSTSFFDIRNELKYSLAGCYYITSVDSFNNESAPGSQICVDNCPVYELPNVFTPNNDEANDLYRPLSNWRFVEKVDFVVYNRWGYEVFRTNDPLLNWDGMSNEFGKPLAEGVYFYTCVVHEIYLDGTVTRNLKGTIHLLR